MDTTTHRQHSTRSRLGRLCAAAALCTASLLSVASTAPSAAASDLGYRPPPIDGDSSGVSPLYLWYIFHSPTVDKPRGNQQEPDGRTPPREWFGSPGSALTAGRLR